MVEPEQVAGIVRTNDQQRIGALFGFGRKLSDTPRGRAVANCLRTRALRSWVTPGSYAWWRLCDDLNAARANCLAVRSALKENDRG